jgi:catechol 2,3-dioxygenase-like lactoylglutathione lyase family enzyme
MGSQMSVKRIVPDIKSKHLDASRQFYVEVLGLDRDGHGLHRDISIAEQSDLLR